MDLLTTQVYQSPLTPYKTNAFLSTLLPVHNTIYYNQLYVHYIVRLTSHTNYNLDAFRCPMMPSSGSSVFTIDFSERIQIVI
jgi:hypothetical protein